MSCAKLMEKRTTGRKLKPEKKSKPLMNVKSQKNNPLKVFYSDDQVDRMREIFSEYWSERIDGETIADILLSGNEGYKDMNKKDLIEEFESIFEENYFGRD